MEAKFGAQSKYRSELERDILDYYGHSCKFCDLTMDYYISVIPTKRAKDHKALRKMFKYRRYLELRKRNYPKGMIVVCARCMHERRL